MNNNPPEQPEDLPDTAREVMAPVQFFGDDRMKAVEGGLQVRDFTPKVEAIDPEEEAAERGAPSSEEFAAESDAVNTDPEDGDDDSPPEDTPVEQPKDGDNGDDTESTATEKKAAKD